MLIKKIISLLKLITPYIFWIVIVIATRGLLVEYYGETTSPPYMDKIKHAALFILLTALGYWAYSNHRKQLYLGLVAYGIITELLQGSLTITRQASFYDWIADIAGIFLCILIIKILKRLVPMKTSDVN